MCRAPGTRGGRQGNIQRYRSTDFGRNASGCAGRRRAKRRGSWTDNITTELPVSHTAAPSGTTRYSPTIRKAHLLSTFSTKFVGLTSMSPVGFRAEQMYRTLRSVVSSTCLLKRCSRLKALPLAEHHRQRNVASCASRPSSTFGLVHCTEKSPFPRGLFTTSLGWWEAVRGQRRDHPCFLTFRHKGD